MSNKYDKCFSLTMECHLLLPPHDNTVLVPLVAAIIITATFIPDYRGFRGFTAVTAILTLSASPCSSLVRSYACAFTFSLCHVSGATTVLNLASIS